jgi:tetratricopeptide (TPR) repeat protein
MIQADCSRVDIRVLTSIGNCHRKLKTFNDGLGFFEMALKQDQQNFYALFGMADCYRGLCQQDRSLEFWNRILEQDPRNKVILTRAGDAYRNLGMYDNAVNYYQRALNNEFDQYAVLGLAMVDKSKGNYRGAIESLERLIQQDPKSYRFYVELADCRIMNGEIKEAVEVLEDYQKLGIRNAVVNELLEKIRPSLNAKQINVKQ